METSNEKYFDDQIRKKLSDVEATAISWDEFAATNQADLIAGKSLRRFLFSDLILLLFLSSYLFLNEYGFSNQINGSGSLFNKTTTISTIKENTIKENLSKEQKANFINQSEVASGDLSKEITVNASNKNENRNLDSKNSASSSNNKIKSSIGNSINGNNNYEASNNSIVKSSSNRKRKFISSSIDNPIDIVAIVNQDLDFLNTKDFILFPSNESNSPDQLNKSLIDDVILNPGIYPVSVGSSDR